MGGRGSCWRLHWRPGCQRYRGCVPTGCWWILGTQSGPAALAQTPRCHHSGSSSGGLPGTFYIWCCRSHHPAHLSPLEDATPEWWMFHWQLRWRFWDLMEHLWGDKKKKAQWGWAEAFLSSISTYLPSVCPPSSHVCVSSTPSTQFPCFNLFLEKMVNRNDNLSQSPLSVIPTGALLSIMCVREKRMQKQVFLFLGPNHILQPALMSMM